MNTYPSGRGKQCQYLITVWLVTLVASVGSFAQTGEQAVQRIRNSVSKQYFQQGDEAFIYAHPKAAIEALTPYLTSTNTSLRNKSFLLLIQLKEDGRKFVLLGLASEYSDTRRKVLVEGLRLYHDMPELCQPLVETLKQNITRNEFESLMVWADYFNLMACDEIQRESLREVLVAAAKEFREPSRGCAISMLAKLGDDRARTFIKGLAAGTSMEINENQVDYMYSVELNAALTVLGDEAATRRIVQALHPLLTHISDEVLLQLRGSARQLRTNDRLLRALYDGIKNPMAEEGVSLSFAEARKKFDTREVNHILGGALGVLAEALSIDCPTDFFGPTAPQEADRIMAAARTQLGNQP